VTDWWVGLPAAETTVSCGDDRHRLRWEAGSLLAVDHEDVEAERTLAALGGERCACVDVLDAWNRHADDLRVLVLSPRGPSDRIAPPAAPPNPTRLRPGRITRGWTTYTAAGVLRGGPPPPAPKPADDLLTLFEVGGGLPDRLAATVAAAWSERLARGVDAADARPQLQAALFGRVSAALRTWPGAPQFRVEVTMADERSAELGDDGVARVSLPFSWLADVWARDLAIVTGRFCLAATFADGRWELTTIGPDFGPPRSLAIVEAP
jgi:hypothetical protein